MDENQILKSDQESNIKMQSHEPSVFVSKFSASIPSDNVKLLTANCFSVRSDLSLIPKISELSSSTVTASEIALPCAPGKQRKLTPVELTVLYYNTVAFS